MDVFTSWQMGTLFLLTLCCFLGGTELAQRPGPGQVATTRVCAFQNADQCAKDPSKCNMTEEWCKSASEGRRMHCYAARQVFPNNTEKLLQGCWGHNDQCYDKQECVSDSETKNVTFCCCDGDYCNRNFTHRPAPHKQQPIGPDGGGDVQTIAPRSNNVVIITIVSLVPLVVIASFIIIGFYCYRKRRLSHHLLPRDDSGGALVQVNGTPVSLDPNDIHQSLIGQDGGLKGSNVNLIEIKARGRFGCVWKAQLEGRDVAVKVFPYQDRQSFLTESDFYRLPQISLSENILQFVCAEVRGNNLNMEYWLITEYHEHGSLYDYLKGHLITWSQLIKLAVTMAKGLAFLHEDLAATKLNGHKPAVAHRDFKSKNVLVKKDLTVCIADLGLALKFEPGKCVGDVHGQVGTRRYMAPEVLEGAINFNRDAFHRIDMYACGLVLWELASRCRAVDGPVGEHSLPFEEEAGLHPTLDEMQTVVVHNKMRPKIKDSWCKHLGMAGLKDTMEECWDPDPEARLSAGCVEERLTQLAQLDLSSSTPTTTTTTTTPPPPPPPPAPPAPPAPTSEPPPPPPVSSSLPIPTVGMVVPNNVTSSSIPCQQQQHRIT